MKMLKKLLAVALISSLFASCSLYYRPMQGRNIGRNNTSSHNAPGFR